MEIMSSCNNYITICRMQSKSMDTFLYDMRIQISNIYDGAFGEKSLQLLFQNENFYFTTILQLSKRSWPLVAINPFPTNVPLLYPLRTSKNLRFSDIFRGYKSGTLAENGLIKSISMFTGVLQNSCFYKFYQIPKP